MQTFVFASKNQHKADEIREILGTGFEIVTQTQAGAGEIDVVEDGDTFEANAEKKAVAILRATGMPTLADDSGLCVDYLDGKPGVYTARYAGEHATDEENLQKLLSALDGVPPQERGAKFVCVIALAMPGEEVRLFRGECHGRISQVKKGQSGFGYDPVFVTDQYGRTMAELEPHIKNAISHRAAALKKLRDALKD